MLSSRFANLPQMTVLVRRSLAAQLLRTSTAAAKRHAASTPDVAARSFWSAATSQRSTRFFSTQLPVGAASHSTAGSSGPLGPSSPATSPPLSVPVHPPAHPPKLPYTVSTAMAVAKTVPTSISSAEEGASCPAVLQQVEDDYTLPHHTWAPEEAAAVSVTHRMTESTIDTLAYWTIKTIRFNFDVLSGWMWGVPTKEKALTRIIFLESVAGVPGSIASTLRHLASLRNLRRDYGWIHTLLEEAENERVHLLTFLELKSPPAGAGMRAAVFVSQGLFYNFFFLAYLVSPRFCHRLVGYLEEEAVKTYTEIIKLVDGRFIEEWQHEPPPPIAMKYWKMPEGSTVRDLLLQVRADESNHRDVNHCLADLGPDQLNPFKPHKS